MNSSASFVSNRGILDSLQAKADSEDFLVKVTNGSWSGQ